MRNLQRSVANIDTATPAQIDGVLFPLAGELQSIERHLSELRARARDEKLSTVRREGAERDAEQYAKDTAAEVAQLRNDIAPLNAEYRRRGGWQRVTFCQSAGGHYHREDQCHTTRGSALVWIAECSGLSDDEVITKVGYHACSQDECWPGAPLHPAWAISVERDAATKTADRDAKYAKGLATREKKVANVQKRIDKANATIARFAGAREGSQEAVLASHAQYDLEWNERDLVWARRELDRWVAKRS